MNNPHKIPCSVGMLGRNAEKEIRRALESVKDFDEIVLCDGGSTDRTVEIAREFGARIVNQKKEYLDADGRIAHFGDARDHVLSETTHEWFLMLNPDEFISEELAASIRKAVAGEPAAYWVPRRYFFKGTVITCSTGYPNQQMRVFAKSAVAGFIKRVHERIQPKEGAKIGWLKGYMYLDISDDDPVEVKEKWRRYIAFEGMKKPQLSLREALPVLLREGLNGVRFFGRWLKLPFCLGKRMPLSGEFLRVWYQYELLKSVLLRISLFDRGPREHR